MTIITRSAIAVMAALLLTASAFSQELEVIQISSFDDLLKIGADEDFPLDGFYELTADIDASGSRDLDEGRGWMPIGKREVIYADGFGEALDTTAAFSGRFDGKGFTVSGLYIDRPSATEGQEIGLFGYAHGAVIENLSVDADSVAGYRYVGALVGRAFKTTIAGCRSSGRVAGGIDVGGLVGGLDVGADNVVRSSYSLADVSGVSRVGGLVGINDGGNIVGCYAAGTVSGSNSRVGGLVGSNDNAGDIWRSYSVASVSGASIAGGSIAGGFVGENGSGSRIRMSYAAGEVSGSDAGGFAGSNAGTGLINSSFWDTERSGRSASDGGTGRTTAQMLDSSTYASWSIGTDSVWGWANNYPYIKNGGIPVYTMTFTAYPPRGGTLSGRTTMDGALHTQKVNPGVSGSAVTAILSDVGGEEFIGWYDFSEGETEKILDSGEYDDFTVELSSDGTALTLSKISGDVEIMAAFTLKWITVTYAPGTGGRIGFFNAPGDTTFLPGNATLNSMVGYGNRTQLVVAAPNPGFNFVRWSDEPRNTIGTAVRQDTAWQDTTFTAIFASDTVTLTYNIEGSNGVLQRWTTTGNTWESQALTLPHTLRVPVGGSGPRLRAMVHPIHADNWQFVGWSDGEPDSTRQDTNVQEDITVNAIFEFITYKLTYVAGSGGKLVEGEWTPPDVDDGDDDDVVVDGDGDDDVVVDGDGGGDGDVVVDGDGGDDGIIGSVPLALAPADDDPPEFFETLSYKVNYNTRGQLVTAVADAGYRFVGWSDGVTTPARSDSLAKNADSTITAIFEEIDIAVKEIDRIIRDDAASNIAIITPAVITASVFTAGPNPYRRGGTVPPAVNFYRQGAQVDDGKLSIYAANGSFIKKVNISDKSTGNNNRRQIGSWDLTDRKGRPVAEGSYLVRGTLARKDGTKERVSIIIGVR